MLEEGDSRLEGFDLHLPKPVLGPDLEEIVAKAMVLRDSRLDLRRIQPGTTGRQSASLLLAFDRKGVRTVSRGMARSGSYGLSQGYCVAQNDMPLREVARTLKRALGNTSDPLYGA